MASQRFQYEYFLENANEILKCRLKELEEHSLLFIAFLLAVQGNYSPGLKLESPEMTSF